MPDELGRPCPRLCGGRTHVHGVRDRSSGAHGRFIAASYRPRMRWHPHDDPRAAAIVAGSLLAWLIWPLRQYGRARHDRADGFPASWYPMFSHARRRRRWLVHPVGLTVDGRRTTVPLHALGGGGFNAVRRQVNRAVAEGRADDVARRAAERLARRDAASMVVEVLLVRGRYDLDDWLRGRCAPVTEEVLATAHVPGRARDAAVVGSRP